MEYIIIRGGGDLASGIALRLFRSGFNVIITELPAPLAVRRTVSFCEAIYDQEFVIEGVLARKSENWDDTLSLLESGVIPVLVDPQVEIVKTHPARCIVDARLLKRKSDTDIHSSPLVIGLGPGFNCGENCHAVVETMRGHYLGRVYWHGSALPDTGQPEGDSRRVLRAPADGMIICHKKIAEHVESGQLIAEIAGEKIIAPFAGILRGLIRPGVTVNKGVKIGDIDQRDDHEYCYTVSDKALAIAGGVLEAILQILSSTNNKKNHE